MKILNAQQIREVDAFTIQNEPIESIDLMERAATNCVDFLLNSFNFSSKPTLHFFCGPGNNGGDGLVMARLFSEKGFDGKISILDINGKFSKDFKINRKRLGKDTSVQLIDSNLRRDDVLFENDEIIIDCIFGSGLSRPIEGWLKELVQEINKTSNTVISIDIPSGLFAEDNSENDLDAIIQSDLTLTIERPKLAYLFPENYPFVKNWEVIQIGLNQEFIENSKSPYSYLLDVDIKPRIQSRNKFSHKGTFGHALLIGGKTGSNGAIILASKACLKSGVGLVSTQLPKSGLIPLQSFFPEAMCISDSNENYVSDQIDYSKFNAIGVGPAIGLEKDSQNLLKMLIQNYSGPLVIDADGLNILSENKTWLQFLKPNTILTPHPKEFERLFGKTNNSYERIQLQIEKSKKLGIVIVLKGAHTSISFPDGTVYFNSTGNSGMATAGSGDVLTGIITSLLAQGYGSKSAAIIGVYIHGLAGDLANEKLNERSILASDITNNLSNAFSLFE